jgi:hypothetical protein
VKIDVFCENGDFAKLAFLQQLAVVAKKKLNWQFCKK